MAARKTGRLGRGIDALIPQGKNEMSHADESGISESKKSSAKGRETGASVNAGSAAGAPARTGAGSSGKAAKASAKDGSFGMTLKLSEIEPNRDQPRKNFDEDSLSELAQSIKEHGLIQPIVVKKRSGCYEIVAGERRWRAAKLAGLRKVPVIIKDYSEKELNEIALIENIQREDLNPVEEAAAYKSLIEEYNITQEELAARVSKSRTAIANSMRLLNLSDAVISMLADGKISAGHARALLPIENDVLQEETAKTVIENKLSVRDTERLVKRLLNPAKKAPKESDPAEDAAYRSLEERLRTIIGSKVSISKKSGGKGKIEIEYYSPDDLDRIVTMLGTIKE